MIFCRIIVVLMSKSIRKITLKMDFSVPCCDIQHIFFFMAIQGNTQLSKLSIRNKLNLEMVFCRISVMITSKPIRKITHSAYKIFKTIFVCFQRNISSYQNFPFQRSWIWKWYFSESLSWYRRSQFERFLWKCSSLFLAATFNTFFLIAV